MGFLHNFLLLSPYDERFSDFNEQYNFDDCHCPYRDDVIITCYYDRYGDYGTYGFDDPTSHSRSSSTGAVVGATIGGFLVCGVVILLVICRIYRDM